MINSASAQFVWLSDLHYDDAPVLAHDPKERLDAAITYINTTCAGASFCVISGDMVETASDASYNTLKTHLNRLKIPWWPMTGNHDRRDAMRCHLPLPETAMDEFIQYSLDLGPARLLCLDSLYEGYDKGLLCKARLDWLDTCLASAPNQPTIVMLHHPPMSLGLPMLDPDRLEQGQDLLKVLMQYPCVKQICFGHVHRPVSGRVKEMSYCGLRSVLYQAPPPYPEWDWDNFEPALEAPELAVVTCTSDQIGIQLRQFCSAGLGLVGGQMS